MTDTPYKRATETSKKLLEQLEERKQIKKLKKKTPEESAFSNEYGKGSKMAKGGRAGLKGGGICKKGMNKKAVGKNS
jgi:hypothetical protein